VIAAWSYGAANPRRIEGPAILGALSDPRGSGSVDGLLGSGALDASGSRAGRAAPRPAEAGPTILPGAPVVRGSLAREVIQRVIRQNVAAVRYCYESELRREPSLTGRLGVRFIIGPRGTVQSATAQPGSTLQNATVTACVLRQVRRWRFPAPAGGGVVMVNYPFIFRTESP